MQETYFKIRKETFLTNLYTLDENDLEIFLSTLKKREIKSIISPKNEEELEIAIAYLNFFKDQLTFTKILTNESKECRKFIKPEENMSLKILINMFRDAVNDNLENKTKQDLIDKYIKQTSENQYEVIGIIKAHNAIINLYKEDLEDYLKKQINIDVSVEDTLILLLHCLSKISKMLELPSKNAKNMTAYSKGYHSVLEKYQSRKNKETKIKTI